MLTLLFFLLGLQEHFALLFAQLPHKLRRSAPFVLPSKYAENDDDDDDEDDAANEEEEENPVAADEAKAQGLAACSEFVFKLFPDAKVSNMMITSKGNRKQGDVF